MIKKGITEEKIIEIFKKEFPESDDVLVGIGDDAGIIKTKGNKLILTTDSLVENVHFRKDFLSPEDIGWKLLSINISDIAAMGGIPDCFLLSMCLTEDITLNFIKRFAKGLKECAKIFKVKLVGGNICRSISGLNFSITLSGYVQDDFFIERKRAELNDDIYISQPLGNASLGLKILLEKPHLKKNFPEFINSFKRPLPPLKLSWILAQNALATSMIDISDGLLLDLMRILKYSLKGAEIKVENIPVAKEVYEIGKILNIDILPYILTGGEDYALLWTSKEKNREKIEKILKKEGLDFYCIGKIKNTRASIILLHHGRKIPLPKKLGFKHF